LAVPDADFPEDAEGEEAAGLPSPEDVDFRRFEGLRAFAADFLRAIDWFLCLVVNHVELTRIALGIINEKGLELKTIDRIT
jgi:hypothetical protein